MRTFHLALLFTFSMSGSLWADQSVSVHARNNQLQGPGPTARPSLEVDWDTVYDFGIFGSDGFSATAADSQGNIFAVGNSLGGGGARFSFEVLTTKYDPSGNLLWASRYDSPRDGFNDTAVDLAIDSDDTVVVLGTGPTLSGDQDVLLFRYDSAGNLLWVFERGGTQLWPDYVNDMTVTSNGNMVLVGYTVNSLSGSSGIPNFTTMMVDTNGNLLWEAVESSVQGRATAVTSDAAGNVYVGGAYVRSYDPNGQLRWTEIFKDSVGSIGTSRALSMDNQGNLFLAGSVFSGVTSGDFLLFQLDPQSGNLKDSIAFGDSLSQSFPLRSGSRAMVLGTSGHLSLVGSTFNGHENDGLLVRFRY